MAATLVTVSLTQPTFSIDRYLFQPGYILLSHWLKAASLSTNKSNTYTEELPTLHRDGTAPSIMWKKTLISSSSRIWIQRWSMVVQLLTVGFMSGTLGLLPSRNKQTKQTKFLAKFQKLKVFQFQMLQLRMLTYVTEDNFKIFTLLQFNISI